MAQFIQVSKEAIQVNHQTLYQGHEFGQTSMYSAIINVFIAHVLSLLSHVKTSAVFASNSTL